VLSLAANVYHWGWAEQRRLLCDCLGPAAAGLRASGLARWFSFMPFDTRGPHVLARLGVRPGDLETVRRELAGALDAYLAQSPSGVELSGEELRRRHEQCRGKMLCALDGEPGIAPNNSYRMCAEEQRDAPGADELREMEEAGSFWALEQLRAGSEGVAAIRWVAAVQMALARAHPAPERYWSHHAGSLLLRLTPAPAEGGGAPDLLPLIGERNLASFARAWTYEERRGPVWPHAERLVEMALAAGRDDEAEGWRVLRSAAHRTLLQLAQPVKSHIPLIVYAWHLSMQPHAPAAS
jgi:hypothetical protein